MTKPTSFLDVELISAYLDGQLSASDKAKLELRLKNEPELSNVLNELSQSRAVLRKLPARRAPRNFTLTPRMAGVKPPLPRAFPFFRLASALAAALFFAVFAANLSVPALATIRAAAPPVAFGMGGGGGGGGGGAADTSPTVMAAAPAAPQANAIPMTATPGAALLAPAPTQSAEATLEPGAQSKVMATPEPEQPPAAQQRTPLRLPIPAWLQFALLGLAVISGGAAYLLNLRAENSWFKARAIKPGAPGARDIVLIVLAIVLVAALAAGIYYVSTTTFLSPAPRTENFPSGPVGGGDKNNPPAGNKGPVAPGAEIVGPTVSGGNKGGGAPVGAQGFTLTPGMGYNFSTADASGLIIALEFPADTFPTEMLVSYIPSLPIGPLPEGLYFPERAFGLAPSAEGAKPQKPFNIVMDYSKDIASSVKAENLILLWWNGQAWQDAATTCDPAAEYQRAPTVNRLNLSVCKMGSFVLAATP